MSFTPPWWMAIGLPLLLPLGMLSRRLRPAAVGFAPWSPLPALGVAVWAGADRVVGFDWLLLGMQLGIDATARVFLLFTAPLWIVAGIYARGYLKREARERFFPFFLLTLGGNLGLIVSQDLVSFYFFFSLMGFSAYGLVVHDRTAEARRAGKVYLSLVIVGEMLLLPALLLIASAAGGIDLNRVPAAAATGPMRNLMIGLTLAGFGIKAGALPLHFWLPLAHPVAPTPASAVLSGTMIKAGLLGWIRFLPLGEATLPAWGGLCIAAGILAAFYGVGVGLFQKNPKVVLAYSSISQMGMMTVPVGVGLAAPGAWPIASAAVLLYALHHALAKGALFLGVGVAERAGERGWPRRLIAAGLLLPALALAGAPLTGGAIAKSELTRAAALAPPWSDWLGIVLTVAAVGTTLLMGRFLFLVWPSSKPAHGDLSPLLWQPWAILLLGVAFLPWRFASGPVSEAVMKTLSLSYFWPIGAGALLIWSAWRLSRTTPVGATLPPGDLVVWVERAAEGLQTYWSGKSGALPVLFESKRSLVLEGYRRRIAPRIRPILSQLERRLGQWSITGSLFLLLIAVLFALLTIK